MPAPLAVDREQVRMLVQSVGCTEAAKQTGIKLATILQWSSRGKWFAPVEQKLPPTMTPTPVIGVISPSDALANTLLERKESTRLGLSLFAARASKVASKLPRNELLANAQDVKHVAGIAAQVWPEASQQNVRIDIYSPSIKPAKVIELDAEQVGPAVEQA